MLYSPAAFAPAEAQRLLERLQARPTAPGHALCTLGSMSAMDFQGRCTAITNLSSTDS